MYGGSRSSSHARSPAGEGTPPASRGTSVRHQPQLAAAPSGRGTAAAAATAGWPRSAASTSPGSMRKPRIFTCSSRRPRYSSTPSAVQRTRSPVRYIRAPGCPENGSGTKRSAVSAGRRR